LVDKQEHAMSQPPDEQASPESSSSPDPEDWVSAPIADLEHILNRPSSRGKRVVQSALLLAMIAAVIFTLWDVVPKSGAGSPTPQPTPLPSALSIVSNVNFGTLTINGVEQSEPLPSAIRLHGRSPYRITLTAPPFRSLTCPFPPPKAGTPWGGVIGYIDGFSPCVAGTGFTLQQQNVTNLEMLFTLADLPKDQQQQINALIPKQVTAQQTFIVPAHSWFGSGLAPDGQITTTRAPAPLTATAFLVPTQQISQPGSSCLGYVCADAGGFILGGSLSGQYWEVATPISLRLLLYTAGGQVASDVTFPFASMLTLYLSYDGSSGWQLGLLSQPQLSQDLTQVMCPTGSNMLASLAQRASDQLYWTVTTLHDHGLAGCELSLQVDAGENPGDEGVFVWRFGALMAASTQAHLTLPQLPLATPADLAAVGA
jgi:hypothetical protein